MPWLLLALANIDEIVGERLPAPLGLVFHLLVEARVFQRDGSLRGQQVHQPDALSRKGFPGKMVFQIKNAFKFALVDDRDAQHRKMRS